MKKVFFKTMMGAGLVGMLSAGCVESPTDLYDPNYVIEQYKAKWEEQFGEVDPSHTWNMAKKVVADINLYGIADDECEVKVYTANPINSTSSLLAKGSVQGNKVVSFDVPSPLQYVFVTATNSRGALVNGYYKIVDGVITVGESVTRAETCPVTVGNEIDMGVYGPADYKVPCPGDFNYLEGIASTGSRTWEFGDFIDIVGLYGVFAEYSKNIYTHFSNLELEKGVEYVTETDGPVEISYMYGATQNENMLGYFYYTDPNDIASAKRYILLADARPSSNITVDNSACPSSAYSVTVKSNDGKDMGLANPIAEWCTAYDKENKVALDYSEELIVENEYYSWVKYVNPHFKSKITGSSYKLVYFDESGNASYDFPAGVHIGFFIVNKTLATQDNGNLVKGLYYSLPSLNKEIEHYYVNENGQITDKGAIAAVTYNYGGQTFLGFEDGADGDMNDILFMINGDFTEEPEELNPDYVEPTAKEWIFACEDLGGVGDFDFNDIVFKVAYASGETTATVTPLAAGGTLEANIMFGSQSLGEIHELLGGSVGTMINTGLGATGEASSVEVQVGEDYSISNNFGGFSLQIVKEDGTTTVDITAPGQGEAPQMICVDAPWAWPKETVSIVKAYPDFGEWGANYANDGWTSNKVAGNVCE